MKELKDAKKKELISFLWHLLELPEGWRAPEKKMAYITGFHGDD